MRTFRCLPLVLILLAALTACDDSSTRETPSDDLLDTSDTSNTTDTTTTAPDTSDPGDVDARSCEQVDVAGVWVLDGGDGVSVSFSAGVSPVVEDSQSRLTLLFERYTPGPDTGTVELGAGGDDANFGNCAHCVYIAGATRERAFFADRGTLQLDDDPYSRRMDATVTNLRLIEVEVDPETRASTPVPDGRCIEVADTSISGTFPDPGWTCEPDLYNDNTSCQCECGLYDPDCGEDINGCALGNPDCPIEPAMPVADCSPEQICAYDPVNFATKCTETCTWADQSAPCAEGTCVYDDGADGQDRCVTDPERLDDAMIGEPCLSNIFQRYCHIENGFSMGYCDPNDVCRALCTSDAECTEPGHTCRTFFGPEGLGYCGPEPTDG